MATLRGNDYIEIYFRKYYASLCYFASQYIDQRGRVIEDMVQDCFVKILEKKKKFESEAHLRNHMYICVKNNCLNYIEKNKLKAKHSNYVLSTESESEQLDEDIFTAEVMRYLMEMIDNLPTQCRQIIHLSYVEGMANDDIAQMLNLSVNTVRAQKMRGKKILKVSMGKADI